MGVSARNIRRLWCGPVAIVVTAALALTSGVGAERALAHTVAETSTSAALPVGVPHVGSYGFLLRLKTPSTASVFNQSRSNQSPSVAEVAAKTQLSRITTAQNAVIADLPTQTTVLYRTHAVLPAVAVMTDVSNYASLRSLPGVAAVYPIAPKHPTNAYAVPLQRAPQVWTAYGDTGVNTTIAIIDTGVDYTHADFGGTGSAGDYQAAKAQLGQPVSAGEFPGPKVVGGYDFAGDSYDNTSSDPTFNPTPSPDPYPLDCNSHGTHVAGTAAGYGENANGTTYTGAYNTSTPFTTMRIGPGMAPNAKLYAYRVFGCAGSTGVAGSSTDLVSEAIDRAMDPNNDGDTSDHVDIANMSLGADFGSPQDADAVMTNTASQLGITMVVASGNGGDEYDVGGSPGDASRALTVANSVDAASQTDALNVTAPASVAGTYAAQRSTAYDYTNSPDLSGDVVRLADPTNLDACEALSSTDSAAVAGHVGFVEWKTGSVNRRCGSTVVAINLANAGATGYLLADDQETISGTTTGSSAIPGVLVVKSAGDTLRAQLVAGHTVTVGGTTFNGLEQLDPTADDQLNSSSSRGIGEAGNVKPDVAAVGTTVFSAGMGTGNQGLTDTGTSMATPMVAGEASLVMSEHPDWTAEQVKADIMNTADQDVYVGPSHTGDRYAPNRVGAGRIDAKLALDNQVLAYDADDPGSVSASFGPLAVSAPTVLHKAIKVQNTGSTAASYTVAYQDLTNPGVTYSVSPDSITVDPRSSTTVTVTLTINPANLSKAIDPTMDLVQSERARQFQAQASGIVAFTGAGVPDLRVPVYAAPRPASTMTQPASLAVPPSGVQTVVLPLSGSGVDQGTGASAIQSKLAGFELQATSPAAPHCSSTVTTGCVATADDSDADLAYVGVSSDAPQLTAASEDPLTAANGLGYFAISAQGSWRTPVGFQAYEVWIDSTGDGVADTVLFAAREPGTDVLVSELQNLHGGAIVDTEALNDSYGDVDTAMFDSDVLVLPFRIGALPGLSATSSRISYAIEAYSGYSSRPVDTVGVVNENTFQLTHPLSFDVLHPGVAVYGTYSGSGTALLYNDSPSSVLTVRRDAAQYALDGGQGVLLLHFQNAVGHKAQIVALKTPTTTSLTASANPSVAPAPVKLTATVGAAAGTPTGSIEFFDGTTSLGHAALSGAHAVLSTTALTVGSHSLTAVYGGDAADMTSTSSVVTHVVKPAVVKPPKKQAEHPTLRCSSPKKGEVVCTLTARPARKGLAVKLEVVVHGRPTAVAHAVTSKKGVASLTWKHVTSRSHQTVLATVASSSTTLAATTKKLQVTVR
jgi:subtilisin family serine protease